MRSFLLGIVLLLVSQSASADPCIGSIPETVRRLLVQRFPEERLPVATDTEEQDRQLEAKTGRQCLLVTLADFNADGQADWALLMPSKKGGGYRLVAVVSQGKGHMVSSLLTWNGPYENMRLSVAPPGFHHHTDSYAFAPEQGAVASLRTRRNGFYFGEEEGAASAYFLTTKGWIFVREID
ncbi:hypothetical protein [Dyella sp. GSA-30]|uniref:hypothetical protein n=1 Tax=Dyella sp. GSA-30 TaxID=2994496 RepID=UPI0024915BF7|nr:hypothetical protein [Dyella sp. GSA-30]BDU22428.1 hypothetical protein DYGSA30_38850 [Dyella sp. GSA-30]